jgi:hypothetical protein
MFAFPPYISAVMCGSLDGGRTYPTPFSRFACVSSRLGRCSRFR